MTAQSLKLSSSPLCGQPSKWAMFVERSGAAWRSPPRTAAVLAHGHTSPRQDRNVRTMSSLRYRAQHERLRGARDPCGPARRRRPTTTWDTDPSTELPTRRSVRGPGPPGRDDHRRFEALTGQQHGVAGERVQLPRRLSAPPLGQVRVRLRGDTDRFPTDRSAGSASAARPAGHQHDGRRGTAGCPNLSAPAGLGGVRACPVDHGWRVT